MPSFYRSAAALAFAGAAFANPIQQSGDACLAAVTGSAALGDANLRKEHCTSFAKTIVTPSAVTVTTTITGAPSASVTEWSNYKRDVTVCPNEVPNYASACNEAGYKSACSAFGVSGSDTTVTIPATTSTKTVYVAKGSNGGNNNNNNNNGVCTSTSTVFATQTAGNGGKNGNGGDNNGKGGNGGVSTVTSTVTKTVAQATVTVTQTAGNSNKGQSNNKGDNDDNDSDSDSNHSNGQNCLTDAKAKEFTDAFADLLEHTSYNGTQGAPGSGYHYNVSAKYLAEDFQDYSDSINFMAGIPVSSRLSTPPSVSQQSTNMISSSVPSHSARELPSTTARA